MKFQYPKGHILSGKSKAQQKVIFDKAYKKMDKEAKLMYGGHRTTGSKFKALAHQMK